MDDQRDGEAVGDRRRDGGRAEVARVVGQRPRSGRALSSRLRQSTWRHAGRARRSRGRARTAATQRVADHVLAAQPVADDAVRDRREVAARPIATLAPRPREDARAPRARAPAPARRPPPRPSSASAVAATSHSRPARAVAGSARLRRVKAPRNCTPRTRVTSRFSALAGAGADRISSGRIAERDRRPRGDAARRPAWRTSAGPTRAHPARAPADRLEEVHLAHEARHERRGRLACRPRPARPPAPPPRGSSPRCGRPWPAPPPGRASP